MKIIKVEHSHDSRLPLGQQAIGELAMMLITIGRRLLKLALAGFSALLLVAPAYAQTALEGINFASLPGSRFEIELQFDAVPPTPDVFMLEVPARLTLDLPDVVSELEERRYTLNSNLAETVVILEAQGRTRLIVNMNETSPYETRTQGRSMYIVLGQQMNNAGAGAVVASQRAQADADGFVPATNPGSDISNINFRRAENNIGQIVLDLARDGLSGNIRESGSRLILEFANASVDRDQQTRLDVSDFATQVQTVSMYNEDDNVVIVADISGEYEFLAYQRNGQYIVNVMSAAVAAQMEGSEQQELFSGEPISLSFQSIEVRTILQILAEFNNYNLIVGDNVSGTMALHLDNVPWDQALEMVLKTRGLAKRLVGNVLYIAPADEIAESERQEIDANRQARELAPLVTEYFDVNYATASDLLLLIRGQGEGEGGGGGLLSGRGRASVDARTNTIIVQDIETVINDIRRLLNRLDVAPQQVLIEARIVNASTQFSEALGIRWGGAHLPDSADQFILSGSMFSSTQMAQNLTDYNAAIADAVAGGATLEQALAQNVLARPSFPEALAVDLGVDSATGSFAIGYQGDNGLLELELSALENSGDGEVIAQPKVTTQDQQNARIESGVQIPYQAQAGGTAGGSTTEFVTAALSLDVTPQITPDGRIIMLLEVHQDSVIPGSGGVPAISTNSVTTRVLVDNGDTIVLGGVFREETTTSVSKTPLLGDLPYVGSLFKRTEEAENKTELLIFITPSIIDEMF